MGNYETLKPPSRYYTGNYFHLCFYKGKKIIKKSLSQSCQIIQQGMLYATCRICQRQKNDTLCGIFSIFFNFFLSANKATLKTMCFPRTCTQPVCAPQKSSHQPTANSSYVN
jgi:hypothetical protein